MLEEIISKFCENSKFINDLDGIIQYLNSLDLNIEEKNKVLTDIFLYNSKMYSLIVEENKELEKVISRLNVTKDRKEIPIIIEEKSRNSNIIEPLKIDVKSYVTRIKDCEKLEDIKSLISNKTSINNLIILKLIEDIIDIKKMLYQDRYNIDNETKLYFENELQKLKIKVEYIKQLINKSDVVELKEDENKMIFLKTDYGNVCAYSDIKDIPVDYYEMFYKLLESIRLGTFKNLKVLSGDGPLKGLSEVKDDQIRVVFDNVSKDAFVIIAMFIKKVDTDAAYRAYLINRKDLYEKNKNNIISLVSSSEEYLEENERIKNKIYTIFTKDNKVKKKGGLNA